MSRTALQWNDWNKYWKVSQTLKLLVFSPFVLSVTREPLTVKWCICLVLIMTILVPMFLVHLRSTTLNEVPEGNIPMQDPFEVTGSEAYRFNWEYIRCWLWSSSIYKKRRKGNVIQMPRDQRSAKSTQKFDGAALVQRLKVWLPWSPSWIKNVSDRGRGNGPTWAFLNPMMAASRQRASFKKIFPGKVQLIVEV